MATDSEDPNAGSGGDWFDSQPAPPQQDDFVNQLTALYQRYGRGAPTADEIAAHRGNPGGLAAIEQQLASDNKAANFDQPPPEANTNTDTGPHDMNRYASILGPSGQPFGVPPAPYQSNPNAPTYEQPATPAWLSTPYVADTWKGGDFKLPDKPTSLQTEFKAPTQAELEASAGYGSRLSAGLLAGNRSAAAQGSVLSGGTQKALNRYAQDYASNEYNNLFGQKVTERGIADQEYAGDVANQFGAFGTNFNVFQTGVQNSLAARQQNEGEFQANVVAPAQQSYANRYSAWLNDNARTLNDYLTNYNISHTADSDYWNRLKDVSSLGEDAAKNSRPS